MGIPIRGAPARKGTKVNFGMWGGRSKRMYPQKAYRDYFWLAGLWEICILFFFYNKHELFIYFKKKQSKINQSKNFESREIGRSRTLKGTRRWIIH